MRRFLIPSSLLFALVLTTNAQEKSVKPGINEPFKNPDVAKFQKAFEGESREVFVQREKIVAACGVNPGMVVADIGAGTGVHTRSFSRAVGEGGQVYAVDIAAKFLEHIRQTSRDAGLRNITPVLCNEDSVNLPPSSIDVAFVCDTYHHFEYPQKTLASLYRAIKPGGKLVVVDFIRVAGKSSLWILFHVRAGQEVVEKELTDAGFRKAGEVKGLLQENYLIIFTKPPPEPKNPVP
jgi:ubiquinone/menaquinone biosynthesis C-methylase UbiE